ncbi:hypothetical protein F7725_016564 [Dissostichus mawsoni]|uniref:Vacuolar fusion protein MON1 homolog n=1 Tax=Dissostichus mawsoni TaxID=36200 RepID=A0A7J5Z3Y0_DISMA|nr:hypothetical protein F7725_016564 [Dissostichus mawsoni]
MQAALHGEAEQAQRLPALKEALKSPTYSVEQVGIPELRHFLYKSKSSGLYTSPEFPDVYKSDCEQERLMDCTRTPQHLHHPTRPLRYVYRCGETENLLAWVSLGDQMIVVFNRIS